MNTGHSGSNAWKSGLCGTLSSTTMMVMMMVITPSLKASWRFFPIAFPFLFVRCFASKPHPPSWLAMVHGFLAAAALTLLVYAAATTSLPGLATLAIILFLVAAAGGVLLNLRFHLNDIPLPKWLVLVHGGIAVIGFICLLMATWV
jgi:hypothetical protein